MIRPALLRGAAFLAAFLLAPACSRETPPGGAEGNVRRYELRGEVVRVRTEAPRELTIRHEAIDDFVDRTGAIVGMNAMTMPFQVDPGVSLEGIAAGDRVRFRFSVDWEKNRLAIESVEELPAGTVLEFRKARPPAAAPR